MKRIAICLSIVFALVNLPVANSATKVCTKPQLVKIYQLAIDFNDNRSNLQQFLLLVNRSVEGLAKSQSDSDLTAERLWSQNYDDASGQAKSLIANERRILDSLKKSFTCSGYGTEIDSKYGFIGVSKKSKSKSWPASITLKAKPVKIVPAQPTALSVTEAKNCNVRYTDRIYIKYTNLKKDYYSSQVYGFENMSDCVVYANLKFTVFCPERNAGFTNQNFPHPVSYTGGLKFEPRESKQISEDGFAGNVFQQCYSITKQQANVVRFSQSEPIVGITSVQEVDAKAAAEKVAAEKAAAETKAAAEKTLFDSASGKTCTPGTDCPIGSTGPGGGRVFYDAGSQQSWGRYLEVAVDGWSGTTTDPATFWCYRDTVYTLASVTDPILRASLGEEIGKGKANTIFMLEGCSSAPKISIFQYANRFTGGGKTDWYIPSKSELNELCKFVNYQPTGNVQIACRPSSNFRFGFEKSKYWSSSEHEGPNAWYQDFSNGEQGINGKATTMSIYMYLTRPIRSF